MPLGGATVGDALRLSSEGGSEVLHPLLYFTADINIILQYINMILQYIPSEFDSYT